GVLREDLEQIGIRRHERTRRVPGEHDAGPDDRTAPPDRDADHALQRRAILRADVAAGNLRVVVEDDRTALRHDRAGHALIEREDHARLTADADVRLLAVDAGSLVDQADRARVAPEQFGGAQ